MARARSIKPSFFKNDELAECEPMARLLFVGLWTLADRDGRLACRPLRIKAELFPYDNCDIGELLGQLQKRGFIDIYESEVGTVLEIPKFAEHQRCHPEERSESLPARAKHETGKLPGEPGNNPAICASFPLPLSSFPFPSSSCPSVAAPDKSAALPKRQPQKDLISWDSVEGWQGITDADRTAWATAYPAATLTTELAKASEWLRSNPTKAKRTNWRKFVTGWLSRCQDGGGTRTGDPRICVGASNPPPQAKRRYWRDKYCKNMTDAEYRLAEQAPAELKSLAAALEVR